MAQGTTQQRVVLVTGGMGGLGETISAKMADAGYKVVVTYSPGNTKHGEWVAGMKARGYDVLAVPCDVADFDSCANAVAEVRNKVGAVDVLVNNAGITRDMTFKKMDKVNWDAVLRTNLDSLFNMTKQVADGMAERGWGRIINIGSVAAEKGQIGQINYATAKGGVIGFTRSLAQEVAARGVTVNLVSPGFIADDTVKAFPPALLDRIIESVPVGRLGTAKDLAGLCAWLASDEAAFVTGANYAINGGVYMS